MPDSKPPEPERSHHTVLESIAELVGEPPKVLLPDSDSQHGATPFVDPGRASDLVPKGRANYQIMGEIARGGMGTILKGHDTDLGRDVAVKVLGEDIAKNPVVVQRFVEEAQIGGQLQHPGIVPVYELGLMADERPYFTMKLIKGRTLQALLQQRKDLRAERGRMLSIFEDVCQTVAYAHSKGVIHRDLKPANIMVGAFGEVQVVDWGLAKVLNRGGVADERRAKQSFMTVIETVRSGPGSTGSDSMIGSVMGTPAYMAPEQAQGEVEKLDERADVFSLGAILCEILTGKPPYVEAEDRTIVQAARAQLDPCRERVEQCEAEDELKRLCLDCLMTSREARPANADEVAGVIHEYLSTVEERAHEAELAVSQARAEAAEQKRARTVMTAVAGGILLVAVLGGGGYYLIEQQRAQVEAERAARVAQVRASIDTLHNEAIELGQLGRLQEAVSVAEQAVTIAAEDEAAADQRMRAEQFLTEASGNLLAAQEERARLEQDRRLVERLEELRLEQVASLGNEDLRIEREAAYTEVFGEYGIDLESDDLVPALERIRERDIAQEVALALDDWSRVRRRLRGFYDESAERLVLLAMDLDPDPARTELRHAVMAEDLEMLLRLADPERLHELPPGSLWILSSHLWGRHPQHRPEVFQLFDHALQLYPDDFVLQSVGGNIYSDYGRAEDALACYAAAASLRPRDVDRRVRLASHLAIHGRILAAIGAYRAATALDPNHASAHYELGLTLHQLGDFDGAIEAYERALTLEDNPEISTDLLVARFYTGAASTDDVVRALEAPGSSPVTRSTLAWALADHPDPAQRNPEVALSVATSTARADPTELLHLEALAVAQFEAGLLQEAIDTLDDWMRLGRGSSLLTHGAHYYVRAIANERLGRHAAARQLHTFGEVTFFKVFGSDADPSIDSDISRWRERSREALGL